MEPQSTTVTIFGQDYTVRGGDAEYVQEVAQYVDERMQEVSKNSQQVSSTKIAILAAMNITEELLRERRSGGTNDVERRAATLVQALEETFRKDGDAAGDSVEKGGETLPDS